VKGLNDMSNLTGAFRIGNMTFEKMQGDMGRGRVSLRTEAPLCGWCSDRMAGEYSGGLG
jgi:hypothetical protein